MVTLEVARPKLILRYQKLYKVVFALSDISVPFQIYTHSGHMLVGPTDDSLSSLSVLVSNHQSDQELLKFFPEHICIFIVVNVSWAIIVSCRK